MLCHFVATKDPTEQEDYWKVRHSAAAVLWQNLGAKKALPVIEDAIFPTEKFAEFMQNVYSLFSNFSIRPTVCLGPCWQWQFACTAVF
ncbi:MAG: FAD-linked oxidase C-terminal domain-containing protein [Candidatus Saccharimonadales bacterium]